ALTKETLRRARELLPALRDIPVEAIWAGYVDSTPDGVPVIDTDTGVGHLVADLVLGRQPITEVAQYRLARFQDSQWGKVASF
ncbi:MAG: D-amino-acid oxidase, partial [Nisaea sp.]